MRSTAFLMTRLGQAGLVPFLVALVIQVGLPVLGAQHLEYQDNHCVPNACEQSAADHGDQHDDVHCQLCHAAITAHALMAFHADLHVIRDALPIFPVLQTARPVQGRDAASTVLVRGPPVDPSLIAT